MNKTIIMTGLILILIPIALAEKRYTPTTEEECNGDICRMTLYAYTKYVKEDGIWKEIEKARSLKDKEGIIQNIDLDPAFNVTINDYNMTFISITIGTIPTKFNTNIPIEIRYKSNDSLFLYETVRLTSGKSNKTYNIDLKKFGINLFDFKIKWGTNSTKVSYTSGTNIMSDTYINENAATTNYATVATFYVGNSTSDGYERAAMIKWFIGGIPSRATINKANMTLTHATNGLDAGESYNLTIRDVSTSYRWNNTNVTWNTRPLPYSKVNATYLSSATLSNGDSGAKTYDITSGMSNAKTRKDDHLTLYLETNIKSGSPGSGDPVQFESNESATSSYRPVLNVEYTGVSRKYVWLEDLISYYTFNSTPLDSTPNYYDTSLTNAVYASGKIGNGLDFDGTGDFATIRPTILNSNPIRFENGNGSVSFWINVDDAAEGDRIIDSDIDGNNDVIIKAVSASGTTFKFKVELRDASAVTAALSSGTVNEDTWYHVVVTRDIGITNTSLFVNGVRVNSTTTGTASITQHIKTRFGANQAGSQDINGMIDEVSFWGKPLNQTEVTRLYNSGNGLTYDIRPTVPSGSTLSNTNKTGETLTATGAGGTTDNDILHYGLSASYLYRFNCNSTGGTLLQAMSTDNTYVINSSQCPVGQTIYVSIWRKQGTTGFNTSATAEVETKVVQATPAGDTCTYGGSGAWTINCNDNCTVSSAANLGSSALNIIGHGRIVINADITTTGTKTIRGNSATDTCIVQCIGGKCIK